MHRHLRLVVGASDGDYGVSVLVPGNCCDHRSISHLTEMDNFPPLVAERPGEGQTSTRATMGAPADQEHPERPPHGRILRRAHRPRGRGSIAGPLGVTTGGPYHAGVPVRPPTTRSTRSLAIGIVGLILGLVLVLALFVLAIPSLTEQDRIEVRLGDDVFVAGDAGRLAAQVAADGPILLPDVANGARDVYLQHAGDDPTTGWLVFDARRPGTGRECTLEWRGDGFADPCDGSVVPPDGGDLRAYEVSVNEDGTVEVDLVMRPEPTTTILITGR